MHTITLTISPAGDYLTTHSDPEVRRLFGTDTIPAAFSLPMPAAEVFRRIKASNPDRRVLIDIPGALWAESDATIADSTAPAPEPIAPAPTSTEPGARVLITGNTYPVKEALRALGGRWNPTARGWMVDADRAAEARAIVASAGPQSRRRSRFGARRPRTTSTYTRFSSGAEVYTNRAGRCEDAPCCGCCT